MELLPFMDESMDGLRKRARLVNSASVPEDKYFYCGITASVAVESEQAASAARLNQA
jgi:hypothetical protein